MNIADRIQSLRKIKGISQEELADKIGVSRQAISKWESEQTAPDIDKIILLSEYFEVTTDYILKGIEIKVDEKDKIDARIFSAVGTLFNFIGLVLAIVIWITEQTPVSVAVGLILIAFGCVINYIGKFIGLDRHKSNKWFWIINVWFIILIPLSLIFNLLQGFFGGFYSQISPLPQFGNSYFIYGLYWLIYISICAIFDYVIITTTKR
ncbi:MAG: helix-turn-helix transcriptional regulator [Erysipelotrichaceae bacterium]|nr:helix-turn-helix transcriptional regulator [Erysipelotrichaceae bacterium]MDD3924874.1 helix-turn-helix transcriptional regulator [Erysipelotrichaceae bacterium]